MGLWNLKEFKALCRDSGLDKLWFYAESLALKYEAAQYHKDKIQQKIKDAPSCSFAKLPIYDFEIAFEVDALMTTLNSIWDILGQLLNECFIHPPKISSKIDFDDILKYYQNSIPAEIQPMLTNIRGNHRYAMIKAYANVSKHVHAIKGEINVDFTESPASAAYETMPFEYKGKQKYKLTIVKILELLQFVGSSIDQVGAKIHESIKSQAN